MLRNFLIYAYFLLCTAAIFSIELNLKFIKLETPLEWIIPVFNLVLMLYLWKDKGSFTFYLKHPIVISTIGLLVAMGLSILNSQVFIHSLKGILLWVNYVFTFAGGIVILNFSPKESKNLLLWCGISYGALLLYAFIHYVMIGINYHHSYQMALPFANGHTLLIAMAFPLWLYIANLCIKDPAQNKYLTTFWIFYTVIIYLSYSRFYWVFATLCMIIVFLFHYPKNIKLTLFGITLCGIIAYFVYLKISEYRNKHQVWLDPRDHTSVFVQIESIFIRSRNESNGERINRWQAAKLMFGESKWTGIGINTFSQRYFFYRDKIERSKIAETTRINDYMNAHNLYIGTMAEQGMMGIIALLGFILSCVYYLRRWGFVGILIFLHYLLLGVIEDFTLLTDIIPCFWICVGWGICKTLK